MLREVVMAAVLAAMSSGCETATKVEPDPASKKGSKSKKSNKKKKKKKKKQRSDETRTAGPAPTTTASAAPSTPTATPTSSVEPAPSDGVPLSLESPSIELKGASAKGLTAKSLMCKGPVDMGYLMSSLAGLADQADAIKACAPTAQEPRVLWTMEGGKTTPVRVAAASSDTVSECIVKAVEKVSSPMNATCLATLDLAGK